MFSPTPLATPASSSSAAPAARAHAAATQALGAQLRLQQIAVVVAAVQGVAVVVVPVGCAWLEPRQVWVAAAGAGEVAPPSRCAVA